MMVEHQHIDRAGDPRDGRFHVDPLWSRTSGRQLGHSSGKLPAGHARKIATRKIVEDAITNPHGDTAAILVGYFASGHALPDIGSIPGPYLAIHSEVANFEFGEFSRLPAQNNLAGGACLE